MTFPHIDDPMTAFLLKAQEDTIALPCSAQRRAAAGTCWRQMGRAQLGYCDALRRKCPADSISEERLVCRVIDMLKLTAPAFGKMAARRLLAVRTWSDRSIRTDQIAGCRHRHMATRRRDAIPARCNAGDRLVGTHRQEASTAGKASMRSSAINPAPTARAAWPCIHTPAQAAS